MREWEEVAAEAQPLAEASADAEPRRARVLRLYARHKGEVYRLALRYGAGDRAFAEDVTQDVFVRMMTHLDRLDDPDDLGGWLYRVTTNRCLSRLRQERLRSSVLRLLGRATVAPEPALERHTIAKDTLARTLEAVRALPPKERVAFGMRHLDGKEVAEIGAVMGHSKGYVSKLLTRASARLRAAGWEVDDDD